MLPGSALHLPRIQEGGGHYFRKQRRWAVQGRQRRCFRGLSVITINNERKEARYENGGLQQNRGIGTTLHVARCGPAGRCLCDGCTGHYSSIRRLLSRDNHTSGVRELSRNLLRQDR
jgi:hypothetical protein